MAGIRLVLGIDDDVGRKIDSEEVYRELIL